MRSASKRVSAILSLAAAAMLLSGCLGLRDSPVALATATTHDLPAPTNILKEPIKTVKPAQGVDAGADDVGVASDSSPTAAQVFDFHPPGSKPGTWREPFIITDNDGPLVAYRNQTAAMLKELQDPNFRQIDPSTSSFTAKPAGK